MAVQAPTVKILAPRKTAPIGASGTAYQRGEDWAEKICAELAALVEVPAATVELAVRHGERGSMSRDLRAFNWNMHGRSVLIAERDYRYRPRDSVDKRSNRVGHNLDNIQVGLHGVQGPPGGAYENWPAFDVFVGFLLFDAWTANTDRHEDNWAVLQDPDPYRPLRLAPSFDHGTALGSGLTIARQRLASDAVTAWCRRGFATRFEDMRKVTLCDLAFSALARVPPGGREHWLDRFAAADDARCHAVAARVPELSEVTSSFVVRVLTANQERICDA